MNLRSPYVLLVTATCLWGGNFVVGKVLVTEVPPILLATIRWCIALLALVPFWGRAMWSQRKIMTAHWKTVLFLGLTGVAGFNTLTYVAVQYTGSINASLMNAATPALIILISMAVLRERVSATVIPPILLSIVGVLWIISRGSWQAFTNLTFNAGDLWMVAAVICWSFYSVGMKKAAGKFSANALFFWQIVVAVIVLLPAAVIETVVRQPELHFSVGLISGLLFIGVLASLVAFTAWNQAIAMIGPSRCAGFLNLIALFSAIFALTFTGERIHLYHLLGAALVLAGVYASNRALKAAPNPSTTRVMD
ncbi:DMT family transporter [Paenibacillus xerothermodurans]|uniref:DMT family transporter n=1 Tax=Paenibacillus xerothermodurans TaxID=1977292 RepID=A0A2W1P1X8_PAEXE|nr:DMT family transporter [Paenibacillus xerothermodurans]PZE21752.1 DMT family transporter [Paenibacillus xerothermodurans]